MPAVAAPDERLVTVVLCDESGALLGQLAPFVVRPQFWPEVDDVIAGVRSATGVECVVLRLLTTSGGYAGGAVSYLAEATAGSPDGLAPVDRTLAAAAQSYSAHRLWWAEPGGLSNLDRWVDDVLGRHGRRRRGPLRQRKTWNLSLLATAPTDDGEVWFKAVPPFLADEGAVIRRVGRVDASLPPSLLGHDSERRAVLLDDVPGEDQWGLADPHVIEAMVERWVAAQAALVDDVEHLLSLRASDLRAPSLVATVESVVSRPEVRMALSAEELEAIDALVVDLPTPLAAIQACGLPDTLVHGDLHPGNWRRDHDRLTLLDWGDVAVGNPVLDMRAFLERLADPALRQRIAAFWASTWQRHVPGSDAARAVDLIAPVSELAAAAAYSRFLDHIENTERVYHAQDPVERLQAALHAVRVGS